MYRPEDQLTADGLSLSARKALNARLISALADHAKALAHRAGFDAQANLYRDLASAASVPELVSMYVHGALDSRIKATAAEQKAHELAGRVRMLEAMLVEQPSVPVHVVTAAQAAAMDETAGVL